MPSAEISVNIHDHGTALDSKSTRVQCNYCGKKMSGFFRLKCHLAGINKDVVRCEKTPENIKECFRNMVLETRKGHLDAMLAQRRATRANGHRNGRSLNALSDLEDSSSESDSLSSGSIGLQTEEHDRLSIKSQKCIGRFFFENGIDFDAVNSPSFGEMLASANLSGGSQVTYRIPSSQDLKGWILQDEVKDTEEYVKRIKDSWAVTGCSILLDEWNDEKGRDLLIFIADCPKGPIYLQSYDISDIVDDIRAIELLVDRVVEDVGADNVVQIVACSLSGWVGEVTRYFAEHRRDIFWTVSASHCFDLMLEKIGTKKSVRDACNKAKKVLDFIYDHPSILKLFRDHSHGKNLITPCTIKSAIPYLTIENIVTQKKNLTRMFASFDWKNSILASREEGKTVSKIVEDDSFWNEAEMVWKGTLPLIRVLRLVSRADKPLVGHIYDTMDQVKETIKTEFSGKKSQYMPFWNVIDEIWDTYLHSPLHAAGYFLNPSVFYSTDFHLDPEVATGLLCCLVRMVKEQNIQLEVSLQLDVYRLGQGAFAEGSKIDRLSKISPAEWWARYGVQCPELQKFAIRILSQTCDGASRYGLKKGLAEKMLNKERNPLDRKLLNDLAFVHYNLHLQRSKLELCSGELTDNELDPLDDWVPNGEGSSFSSRVKVEPS